MSGVLRGVMSRALVQSQHVQKATLVSGPPRVHIGVGEKLGLGGIMIFSILAPVGYILANLKNYRGRPGEE